MKNQNLGLNKKSFSMPYNGGEIWFEHPTSSLIAVNLDETMVNQEIIEYILEKLYSSDKLLRKVAFVGLNTKLKRYIKQQKNVNIPMNCIDDFEQAKKWLIP